MVSVSAAAILANFTAGRMSSRSDVDKSHPKRSTRKPSRFVTLLMIVTLFQNVIIYKLMKGTTTSNQFTRLMESMMDFPREAPRSSMKPISLSGRKEKDVIIYLAQFSNVHSSYGAQSDAASKNITGLSKFKRSLDLLNINYLNQFPCDIIIFYDSSSPPSPEVQSDLRTNLPQLKFRELNDTWWNLPYGLEAKYLHRWKRPKFSIGYRHMMRWFAVLIWPYLQNEGYTHVMRMDDDSYIHSKIQYNLFDFMRRNEKKYGFRQPVRDSAVGKGYDDVVNNYLKEHPNATTQDAIDRYNNVSRRVGFYNNWFIADVGFFMSEPVRGLLKAIDESKLIYTERTGDLVIHSTAVRLFARPHEIQWFRDFTYEHMTLCRMETCGKEKTRLNYKGCPENGGVSRGLGVYTDDEWRDFATKIQKQFNATCEVEIDWNFIGADDSVRDCEVKRHRLCMELLETIPASNGSIQSYGWQTTS